MVDGSLQFELEAGVKYAADVDGLNDHQSRFVERVHGRYAKPTGATNPRGLFLLARVD